MSKRTLKGEIPVPAFCTYCGTIFQTRAKIPRIKNSRSLFFSGPAVFCPNCARVSEYRIDMIHLIEDAYEVIKKKTLSELMELKHTIEQRYDSKFSEEDFISTKKEIVKAVPELKSFKDLIPKTRIEAYTVIGIILTIITMAVSCLESGYNQDKQQVINTIIINSPVQETTLSPNRITIKSDKIGRNSPCHCGSGLKYKKCHGKADFNSK